MEHIGSTGVKGLLAKPTVDIMVGLQKFDWLGTSQGYEDLGEAGVAGRSSV